MAKVMTCHNCKIECNKFGRDRKGHQRFRCSTCRKTFTEAYNNAVQGMHASKEKAAIVIRLLAEGNSIRSIERITGMHRDTIMRLLVIIGDGCERMLEDRIRKVRVTNVQCDEIWVYVGCKEKRVTEDHPVTFGDAYTFVAIERGTKLV